MFNNNAYLYVEDDSMSREVMNMIMKNAMRVENFAIFEDSDRLMERIEALPFTPTLIFLDIHMKPINGFESLELLRSDPKYAEAKIIALTASVMNEEIAKLRVAGFNGAIAKPVNIRTFPGLVTSILNGETIWHIS